MIPIRDAVRSTHFPIVNVLIIAANVVVFAWQLMQGPRLQEAFFFYGIVPVRYSSPEVAAHFNGLEQILPFFTSMFLHGGFLHILGNMWFLYIFGDNIEDTIGHIRYFLFYVFCGLTAGLVHLYTNWGSQVPTIGASGAIAGVMGAYLLLFPRAKILTLIPIFFFFQFFELPAFIFLGYWFFIQLISAGMTKGGVGGIAFWAHIGGFIAGLVLVKVFQILPRMGWSKMLQRYTQRQSTPRVHPIRPQLFADEWDVEGEIWITPREALHGARKFVSVPQGRRNRTVIVTIPPGVEEGKRLRLRGLGQADEEGHRGDLYLKIRLTD
jgi:membrane associated rhomboid family serine protease